MLVARTNIAQHEPVVFVSPLVEGRLKFARSAANSLKSNEFSGGVGPAADQCPYAHPQVLGVRELRPGQRELLAAAWPINATCCRPVAEERLSVFGAQPPSHGPWRWWS